MWQKNKIVVRIAFPIPKHFYIAKNSKFINFITFICYTIETILLEIKIEERYGSRFKKE